MLLRDPGRGQLVAQPPHRSLRSALRPPWRAVPLQPIEPEEGAVVAWGVTQADTTCRRMPATSLDPVKCR